MDYLSKWIRESKDEIKYSEEQMSLSSLKAGDDSISSSVLLLPVTYIRFIFCCIM